MLEFEWDNQKEIKNIQKHKISFSEAVDSFLDPKGILLEDKSHSSDREERFYWVGISKSGLIITTYFTKRNGVIRIIGAVNWRKFRRIYYECAKKSASKPVGENPA
jgi:hypothetical protein